MKIIRFLAAYLWRAYHRRALQELQRKNPAHPDINEIVLTIRATDDTITRLWGTCASA